MSDTLIEELHGLPDAALDDRIRELELERRRLDAELATAISIAEHRQLPAIDGHRSINAYLRATLNWSDAEASRFRSAARAVDHIDGLGDAWREGRFGISQVGSFGRLWGNRRVRDRLLDCSSTLIEHAEQLSHRDFVTCVERFTTLADADGAHDARDDAVEHRDARVVDVGGMVDIAAHGGDGVATAELVAIHRRFTEAEYRADVAARRAEHGDEADQFPLARTARQRRFDALVAIFRSAASTSGVGSVADPLVNIVIDAATWSRLVVSVGIGADTDVFGIDPTALLDDLVATPDLTSMRCETTTGVAVHPHDVLRAALAGHVRRVVVDSAGVVVDLGRRQRLFVGSAREAAKLLVRHCEHPGCGLPTDFCDVDHADEWAAGGSTTQPNSRIRCGSHNTLKSRHRWSSERAMNGRTFTIRSDGTMMLPVGVRPPIFPDNDDEADTSDNLDDPVEIARMTQAARRRIAALIAS